MAKRYTWNVRCIPIPLYYYREGNRKSHLNGNPFSPPRELHSVGQCPPLSFGHLTSVRLRAIFHPPVYPSSSSSSLFDRLTFVTVCVPSFSSSFRGEKFKLIFLQIFPKNSLFSFLHSSIFNIRSRYCKSGLTRDIKRPLFPSKNERKEKPERGRQIMRSISHALLF